MSALVDSFDPDADGPAEPDADAAGGIGVYAEFAKIDNDAEAFRRWARLKPLNRARFIAEHKRGMAFRRRYGGRA